MQLFSLIIWAVFVILVTLFPVYLWAYGISRMGYEVFHRKRFILGLLVGSFSVFGLFFFSFLEKTYELHLFWYGCFFLVFLAGFVLLLLQWGSIYIRSLLQKLTLIHTLIIVTVFSAIVFVGSFFDIPILSLIALQVIVASLLEESSKHLISLGTTGINLRFSREEILFLNFFCVLGFVFAENILYIGRDIFIEHTFSFFQWGFRSFFTLIAHIFAASLCTFFWWKALSYQFFSRGYLFYFSLGFILATLTHALYNTLVGENLFIAIICFSFIGYGVFVMLLSRSSLDGSR